MICVSTPHCWITASTLKHLILNTDTASTAITSETAVMSDPSIARRVVTLHRRKDRAGAPESPATPSRCASRTLQRAG
jgi:hypothetical protein